MMIVGKCVEYYIGIIMFEYVAMCMLKTKLAYKYTMNGRSLNDNNFQLNVCLCINI